MPTQILDTIRAYMHRDGAVLLPEMELLLFVIGILVIDLWFAGKDKYWNPALALAGTIFSALTLWLLRSQIILTGFHETVIADSFSLFFAALLLAATAMLILLSMKYPQIAGAHQGRYYALLLCACIGMMLMVSGIDLLVIFLALEVVALSCYFVSTLSVTDELHPQPNPASVSYLLGSALGSAILAYGFSLLYGVTGTTNLSQIGSMLGNRANLVKVITLSRQSGERGAQMHQLLQARLPEAVHWHPFILQALPVTALALICVALIFKAGVLAFPLRRSDAISGDPAIALRLYLGGAFLTATIALLLRLSLTSFADSQSAWGYVGAAVSCGALVWGNVAAFRAKNIEQTLAYASIAQAGYLLLGLVAANERALTGIAYYLLTYLFAITGAFAVVIVLRCQADAGEQMSDLENLFKRSPTAAILLTIFMLSLAGVPPTAGFLGKYYIVRALVETGHPALAWFAALAALPLAYCYLRVMAPALRGAGSRSQPLALDSALAAMLGACLFVSLAAGLYSEPFTRLARYAFGQ